MSNREKSEKLLSYLKAVDGVSNVELDSDSDVGDSLISGQFEFNEYIYSFIHSPSDVLSILEISYTFIFEQFEDNKSRDVYLAVNEFNRKSVAIKAAIIKQSDDTNLIIDFTYGMLSDTSDGKEPQYDLEPAISILQLSQNTMSEIFSNHGIVHWDLNDEDNEEEEP